MKGAFDDGTPDIQTAIKLVSGNIPLVDMKESKHKLVKWRLFRANNYFQTLYEKCLILYLKSSPFY